MDELQILKHILSESGIVAFILSIAVLWQTKQLSKANKDNKELNSLILQLALSQVSVNKEIQAIIERIIDDLLPAYGQGSLQKNDKNA